MTHFDRSNTAKSLPLLTVLIPASNEEALIGRCLRSLLESEWTHAGYVEVIVISNGSKDRTTEHSLQMQESFCEKGWSLRVLDRKDGGKLGALNAGDHIAKGAIRVYLDADVTLSNLVLTQIYSALDVPDARYASGTLMLAKPASSATRAYARIYAKVPFMKSSAPGAGLFAVNAPGRLRWGAFPNIISDDTFVRLSFRPDERVQVGACYTWPLVEGWRNLIRVRRRQNAGVDEIKARYPHLLMNDDKTEFTVLEKVRLALRDPIGFAIYAGVALVVRFTPAAASGWTRGR
ncbi:glycosyltransferase [Marivita sp. S2033]|uniref:glycosyltransferase n=1 Tax=Marivita sp. S2033 TaxID=3373187 RepID=UPI0039827127